MHASRSTVVYLVYLLAMLRLAHKTQHRAPNLQGLHGFFWMLFTGEYAHLLLLGNVLGFARSIQHTLKQGSSVSWVRAGLTSLHLLVLGRLGQLVRANVASARDFQEALVHHNLLSWEDAKHRIGKRSWGEWWSLWNPLPVTLHFPGTVTTVPYAWVGERHPHPLYMDIYRHTSCGPKPPILLFVHGGGWVFGTKANLPAMFLQTIARHGWLVVSIDYRKAPFVGFPDNFIDCKRAIAFWRSSPNAAAYDADTSKIVVCGESAGGHMVSLLALTHYDKTFQPGFEDVDCSVMGCIDLYGAHDLTDRFGLFGRGDVTKGNRYWVERFLMNRRLCQNRAEFETASPLYHLLHEKPDHVPPFFLLHGAHDSVLPVEDSQEFYNALVAYRRHKKQWNATPDVFIPLPGAEHAFNVLPSPRAWAYGDAVAVYLDVLLTRTPADPGARVAKL
ncbi:Aste57867_2497 [Aphanomyces stellatus]|uniref:Aste57867_2497 protein n=1 Tax=Aphanomyces stellatus TaxID=120398 RepID=A0A485KA85_9STRA|nr:hypothetical protein As57867_002490 [Aphanomyces stellatus]VFT79696.1 Aste57867_2497 [Aphanomyces stellatus]